MPLEKLRRAGHSTRLTPQRAAQRLDIEPPVFTILSA
jgi:hypothetical protein